jgi:hypothetical protein
MIGAGGRKEEEVKGKTTGMALWKSIPCHPILAL